MLYTFDNYRDGISTIIDQLSAARCLPDTVIGITRGGCIAGVHLSHLLCAKFQALDPKQNLAPINWDAFGKVLLVDDIIDSGSTLDFLTSGGSPSNVKVATLIYNIAQRRRPDFFGTTIDRRIDKEWVTFWWETECA